MNNFSLSVFAAGLLHLVMVSNAGAQILGGSTVDAATRQPIAGVTITVADSRGFEHGKVVSDSLGVFRVPLPRPGTYQIHAQHPGHAPHTTQLLRVRRGERIALELRLGAYVAELAPLIVVGRARHRVDQLTEFYDRMERQKKTGLGRFITREDIEQTATATVNSLLLREPSIRLFRAGNAPVAMSSDPGDMLRAAANIRSSGVDEVITLSRRGSTPCAPMIYLDGVLLGRASNIELPSFVSLDEIEGVEIYRSGFETPGEMADDCGSIGVWTRRLVAGRGNPFSWKRVGIAAGFIGIGLLLTR